jgi:hypothetical protein
VSHDAINALCSPSLRCSARVSCVDNLKGFNFKLFGGTAGRPALDGNLDAVPCMLDDVVNTEF